MSDGTVISYDEFRRRRFAPPRRAHPVLSRDTRRRLQRLSTEEQLLGDFARLGRELRRLSFAFWFGCGLAGTLAIVAGAVVAWHFLHAGGL